MRSGRDMSSEAMSHVARIYICLHDERNIWEAMTGVVFLFALFFLLDLSA